jgi:hypothetical protein
MLQLWSLVTDQWLSVIPALIVIVVALEFVFEQVHRGR